VKPIEGLLFADDVSAIRMHALKRQTEEARADAVLAILKDDHQWTKNNDGPNEKTPSTPNGDLISKILDQNTPNPSQANELSSSSIPPGRKSKSSKGLMGLNYGIITPSSDFRMGHAQYAGQETPSGAVVSTLITATRQDGLEDFSATTATSALETSGTIQKASELPQDTSKETRMSAWVLWCDTNSEQETLEKKLGSLVISITGSMTAETKERLHDAWLNGERPVMLTKSAIFGMGVNWQHCSDVIFVGRNFSYESYYQAVRRCWRFGQTRPVHVHLIVAEGEEQIGRILERKADAHADMKSAMIAASKRALGVAATVREKYNPTYKGRLPAWIM
jgi:hypothetical protein